MKKKITPIKRLDIDEYFLKIASVVAERSTCRHHHIGAVAVRDKHILTTGYNGAPSGDRDCLELGCLRDELGISSGTRHELCRAIHAEQNVIIQAGLHGVSLEGATIYCTHTPCVLCTKMMVNARISRFVTFGKYPDEKYKELFKGEKLFELEDDKNGKTILREAKIDFVLMKKPSERISFVD